MGEHDDEFHVDVVVGEHAIEVRVAGEIDIATVDELRAVLWAQPDEPSTLRVELSGVNVLSAAGFRLLVAVHLDRRRRGGQLVLCNPNPTVRRALRAMRVNRIIPIVGTNAAPTSSAPRRTWRNAGPPPRRSPTTSSCPASSASAHPANAGPAGVVSRAFLIKDGGLAD